MENCNSELSDSPNKCFAPTSHANPFLIEFDFKVEEQKAVADERYEDAAKLRDRIIPFMVYEQGKGFHISYTNGGRTK